MRHRSKEGKREAVLRELINDALRRYGRASAHEKQAIHDETLKYSFEMEKLAGTVHHYTCLLCSQEYSADSAHGFGFLASWTRCDETGRPVRAEAFGVRNQPKIGFCPSCAEKIEQDIDSE